jgi:hypothetical protein
VGVLVTALLVNTLKKPIAEKADKRAGAGKPGDEVKLEIIE